MLVGIYHCDMLVGIYHCDMLVSIYHCDMLVGIYHWSIFDCKVSECDLVVQRYTYYTVIYQRQIPLNEGYYSEFSFLTLDKKIASSLLFHLLKSCDQTIDQHAVLFGSIFIASCKLLS